MIIIKRQCKEFFFLVLFHNSKITWSIEVANLFFPIIKCVYAKKQSKFQSSLFYFFTSIMIRKNFFKIALRTKSHDYLYQQRNPGKSMHKPPNIYLKMKPSKMEVLVGFCGVNPLANLVKHYIQINGCFCSVTKFSHNSL